MRSIEALGFSIAYGGETGAFTRMSWPRDANLGTRVLATNDEARSRCGMDRMRDPADPGERLIATRLLDLTAARGEVGEPIQVR
ncbi:MAG TPA: hypothetical protein VLA89_03700 [Gemmatimonadales bacterium]|nr:hypothetical protein [Gemmatimonadales bacterium]